MKLNPYSYATHKKHLGLIQAQMAVDNHSVKLIEKLFSPLFKSINKKDPHFCYTCLCNDTVTEWKFAYSDRTVYREARVYIEESVDWFINHSQGLIHGNHDEADYPTNDEGCQCPFSGD